MFVCVKRGGKRGKKREGGEGERKERGRDVHVNAESQELYVIHCSSDYY